MKELLANKITAQDVKLILQDKNWLNDFIEANENLILSILNKTCPWVFDQEDFEEYLSDGRLGLYKALVQYDPSKNVLFDTFAVHVIYCKITNRMKVQKRRTDRPWNQALPIHNTIYKNDSEIEICEIIKDECCNVENEIVSKSMIKEIKGYVAEHMNEDYVKIFDLMCKGLTQTEISKIFNCSRENIRQKMNRLRLSIQPLVINIV